jgi:hypothetical protein
MLSDSPGSSRPVLYLPPTPLEKRLQLLSLLVLLIIAGLLFWGLLTLPDVIPIHYSLSGPIHPDVSGSKWILLLFFLLPLALYGLLSLLSCFPHRFNYPVAITRENAERQYRLGRLLLAWLKLSISLLFAYLAWMFIQGALNGLNAWIFAGFLLFALLPLLLVIGYFFRALRMG